MADEPSPTDDTFDDRFDDLGRRAGRALQEPPPQGGVARIAERGRRQQTIKVAVACVGIIAVVVGGIALLTTESLSGNIRPASTTASPPPVVTETSTRAATTTTSPPTTSVPAAITETTTDGKPHVVSLVSSSGRSTTFTPGPQVGTSFPAFSSGANVEFSADGATLAVVTGSTMRLYNATDLTVQAELPCPIETRQLGPEWTATARSLITALNARGSLAVGASCQVTFSSDGRMAAAGNVAWDTRSGRSVRVSGGGASVSPDGKTVVTGGTEGIRVWNTATGALVATLETGIPDEFRYATFASDGLHIAGFGRAGVTVWDARTLRKQTDLVGRQGFSVVFAATNRRVATATFDGISLWDATNGAELLHVEGASECFNAAASRDATLLATAGIDGSPVVVDAVSGLHDQLKGPLYGRGSVDLAFSPDGTRLAVASGTGIQIWLITH